MCFVLVLGNNPRLFRRAFDGAQDQLRRVFGMEMAELPVREKRTLKEKQSKSYYNRPLSIAINTTTPRLTQPVFPPQRPPPEKPPPRAPSPRDSTSSSPSCPRNTSPTPSSAPPACPVRTRRPPTSGSTPCWCR